MPSAVPDVDPSGIREEVGRVQASGRQRIGGARERLDSVTRNARGASAEAADDVKEW